jgi:hypothetical protein
VFRLGGRAGEEAELELAVALPPGRVGPPGPPVPVLGYSYIDGEPHAIPLDLGIPQTAVDPAAVQMRLGTGRFADMLRSVGLPRRPEVCQWGEGLTICWHQPRPLATGIPDDGSVPK